MVLSNLMIIGFPYLKYFSDPEVLVSIFSEKILTVLFALAFLSEFVCDCTLLFPIVFDCNLIKFFLTETSLFFHFG